MAGDPVKHGKFCRDDVNVDGPHQLSIWSNQLDLSPNEHSAPAKAKPLEQNDASARQISRPGVVERAFQIAREGRCLNAAEVEQRMKSEGLYELGALDGRMLRRQLKDACDEARGIETRPRPVKKAAVRRRVRPQVF